MKKETNIFIVDDNVIFALALKAYIENAFENLLVKVYTFETGEKCLENFMQVMPELVILDYNLNTKSNIAANGLEILDKIKSRYIETSVIMLTSNISLDIALESFHHGASDYVVKTEYQFKKINYSISKILTDKEIVFQKEEEGKRAVEAIIANIENALQNEESEKRAAVLSITNSQLAFQKKEVEKREAELNIANIQKADAEKSRLILENINRNITDSIIYAKRIQQAKLPRKEEIYASLPQSFVLFKPKDIVSGDFYFFQKYNETVFLAAADCTGHGVPGAFMSMIGSEKLEDAIAHSLDPSEILKHLNIGIKNSLHQSNSIESTRDGMDIAICSIEIENCIVRYSGANRPIWIIRKGQGELEEIKGTKKAIGGLTEDDQHFECHEI